MNKPAPYHEKVLHWLWRNRHLQNNHLTTVDGKKVLVHHPGYLNQSDGPDFTNARITIGALKWHGDVEIHWQPKDWVNHKHYTNDNFNKVILHVVFDDSEPAEARRQDDTLLPTLCMKPFLSQPLRYFFQRFQQPHGLPCAGNIAAVPQKVLTEQFECAHDEYFEQKVNDLLPFYEASLPLSKAWKRALITALFDGLGISYNREPMQRLACELLTDKESYGSDEAFIEMALRKAGIEPEDAGAPFHWKRKGSRPANHPKNRIRQGCYMLRFINRKPFKWWLRTGIKASFDEMLRYIDGSPGVGAHRSGVLFGTVWIPAYYLLGDLTGTRAITSKAKKMWGDHRTKLPSSIIKPFKKMDIPASVYEKKLGTVHQYRAYCKQRQCQQCKIFQYLIST
jgi:hypothetical protein